jgi:hypothetical protein
LGGASLPRSGEAVEFDGKTVGSSKTGVEDHTVRIQSYTHLEAGLRHANLFRSSKCHYVLKPWRGAIK